MPNVTLSRTRGGNSAVNDLHVMGCIYTVFLSSILISILGLAVLNILGGPFYYGFWGTLLIFFFPTVTGYQLVVCLIDSIVRKRYSPTLFVQFTFLLLLYVVLITANVIAAYYGEIRIQQMWIMVWGYLQFLVPFATVITVVISRVAHRYAEKEEGYDIIGKY